MFCVVKPVANPVANPVFFCIVFGIVTDSPVKYCNNVNEVLKLAEEDNNAYQEESSKWRAQKRPSI